VVRLRPDDWQAHHVVGAALTRAGALDEAERRFRRAAELDPSNAAAHTNLSRALALLGKSDEAVEEGWRAVRLAPDSPPAYEHLAALLVQRREYAGAIDLLRKALAVRPNEPVLSLRLAWLLATVPEARLRDGAEAVRLAEKVLARAERPEVFRAEALDVLAAAYGEVGRLADARRTAGEALYLAEAASPERVESIRLRMNAYAAGKPHRLPGP